MYPIFFHIGSFAIHTYGVLVAIGFLLGLAIAGRRARQEGMDPRHISDIGIWLIVAGMGGAKLFHIVFCWDDFIGAWRMEGLRSLREGFVFYGGFLGAVAATIVFARRRHLALWKLADVLAPSVALGHVFGRLGCFFNGCCYGKPCALPWGVRFPASHLMHQQCVHPTELYEALGNLILFAALTALYRRKRFDGQIWWSYVLAYSALRFGVEFFRGDYDAYYSGVFTIAHVIAVVLMLVGVAGLRLAARKETLQRAARKIIV